MIMVKENQSGDKHRLIMWRCSRASRITAGARKVNAKGGTVKGGAIFGAKGEAIFDAAIHCGLPRCTR